MKSGGFVVVCFVLFFCVEVVVVLIACFDKVLLELKSLLPLPSFLSARLQLYATSNKEEVF